MSMSGNRRPSQCWNRIYPEHSSAAFPLYQYAEFFFSSSSSNRASQYNLSY